MALILLSPAKAMDFTPPPVQAPMTRPVLEAETARLAESTRRLSVAQLRALMDLSEKLAVLNRERFQAFDPAADGALQAAFAFNGDVYEGLDARSLDAQGVDWAQDHVRILSGLYGLLRPLDLMQAYRLEMGTRLANVRGKDLYAFWGESVTAALNEDIAATGATALVNLASEEYFKSVKPKLLDVPLVAPVFEDWKNGNYKIISFFAKRARGMMARYAIERKLKDPEALKDFDTDGYAFDPKASGEYSWVFRRRAE